MFLCIKNTFYGDMNLLNEIRLKTYSNFYVKKYIFKNNLITNTISLSIISGI